MNAEHWAKLALKEAEKSPCKKRKVGAVLLNRDGDLVGLGHNFNPNDGPCELADGSTDPDVIHAEIMALETSQSLVTGGHMHITHHPCVDCQQAMEGLKVTWEVIEEFMKFDTTKLRYDLVPPSAIEALATVLTYGAKKYKPNNWKNVDDPERYIAAAMRHFEAYRNGEALDPESGKPHLAHAMTNLAFLLDLKYTPKN